MTRFWWVRHGPTHEKNFVGWRDVPADLSDQATIDRLADHLPPNALVISSDLIRASCTADAITRERIRLPNHRGLREFNFGAWDGMHFSDVAKRDPILSRQFWESPGDISAPDGESWNAVAARVNGVVDDLIARHTGQDIILTAHIGVIMTQIWRASGSTPYQAMGHQIDNLSVTQMSFGPHGWDMGAVNHKP